MQHFLKNKNGDFKQFLKVIEYYERFLAIYKTKSALYKTRRKNRLKKTHI